jgi:hypothetical protein
MGHIGDDGKGLAEVFLDLPGLGFEAGDARPQILAFLDQRLFRGGVFFLGNQLGDFVLPLLDSLRFLHEALALVVELYDAVHVGLDIAFPAVAFDGIQVLADELCVQHSITNSLKSNQWKGLLQIIFTFPETDLKPFRNSVSFQVCQIVKGYFWIFLLVGPQVETYHFHVLIIPVVNIAGEVFKGIRQIMKLLVPLAQGQKPGLDKPAVNDVQQPPGKIGWTSFHSTPHRN